MEWMNLGEWQPTNNLRWVFYSGSSQRHLQQLWKRYGEEEWRGIEGVILDLPSPPPVGEEPRD